MDAAQTAEVVRASRLMDLGMLEMDDAIRLRRGQPQGGEMAMIKNHPLYGERMLSHLENGWAVLPLVRSHHEWWNGWGYPDGLLGESIPLGARILGLADAFVAMLSPRAYREARSLEGVLDEIVLYRGKQFDPRVVDAFLELTVERFDLPPSEWARLQEGLEGAGGARGKAEVVASAGLSGPGADADGEWSIDEDRELLEALWDINGVKRLSRVA
jgi:HD-GYP domain-containing protein (c-di-GMP phosphodiesterase class II)